MVLGEVRVLPALSHTQTDAIMHKSRPTLAEIRRINKRRERLSTLQENFAISSMGVIVVGFTLLMMGAMVQSEVLTWAGVAGMIASPVLAIVALIIDTINN
jgi:ABC-type bacteriocin/lantibiotic exporter with double-glycine peptidase domain